MISRRHFLQHTSAIAILLALKSKRGEALVSLSGTTPFGKNQVGLNGINYYSNIHPFTNWWKNGSRQQLDLDFRNGISSLTWSAGVATATTTVAHGLYQAVGKNSGWPLSVTASNPGYNHSSSKFDCTITGPSTFTYPVATDPGGSRSSGSYSYSVYQEMAPNSPRSAWGLNSNLTQYFDADGNVQANIPGATSLRLIRIYHGIDAANGAIVPPGYSRAGQKFTLRYRPLGGSTVVRTFVWEKIQDGNNQQIVISDIDPRKPPRDIYVGLTDNLAAWDAGLYWEPAYENMLKASAGVIRFMDMMQTNGAVGVTSFSKIPSVGSFWWGCSPYSHPPGSVGMPIAVMTQLANRTNKHPWFCVPTMLGVKNVTISGITKANPAVVTTPFKHTFAAGDIVIPWLVGGSGSNSGFGQQSAVTFTIGEANCCNWPGHTFVAGQNVWFSGGVRPTNVLSAQSFYVTNVGNGTFQLATTLENALSGKAITLNGKSSGAITGASVVNRNQFVVGAVTDYTLELKHCDSTNFGTPPTTGYMTTPFSLAGMAKEITSLVTAIKDQLGTQLIPRFEWGNELWNSFGFTSFHWSSAQAHNFVDSSGVPVFPADDNNKMSGYLIAHTMKIIRDVYGGSNSRSKWHGILATHTANGSVTSGLINGLKKYITSILGDALTIPDLINDIAVTGYYGGIFKSNGTGGHFSNVTISVGSPATAKLSSGSNALGVNGPIIFTTTGKLPIDAATGKPLERGDMSPQCSFNATIASGILNVISGLSGTIAAGMTVFGAIPQNGVKQCIIQPFGTRGTTGVGGIGTYAVSDSQTIVAPTSMLAQDITLNTGVYWTLDTGSPFRFSATRGGAPVNISDPGTGTHNCLSGISTLLVSWMNQSAALNISSPAKYPSKYTYWNTMVNQEVLDGAITGIGGAINLNRVFKQHVEILAANNLIPAVGIVQYEGGQSNEPQGNSPNGVRMTANPLFQEFWPQAVNTVEDGAVWTAMVTPFAKLPTVSGQPTLRVSFPSKFTDANNITFTFGFGGLTFVDHYAGIGSPNWQNTTSPGGLWSAVLATN